MHKLTTKAFCAVVLISILTGCSKKQPDYGDAPQFTLPDVKGGQVSLSDFEGKVVIVNFWATYCTGCIAEMPHFVDLYDKYKNQGFEMIGISLDQNGLADVKPFLQKKPLNYTILLGNPSVSSQYKTKGLIPATYVIDKIGKIRRKYIGYRDKAVIEKDIKTMLGESIESLQAAANKEE